jgi:hypothetical protein
MPCVGKTFSVDNNDADSACWASTGTLSWCLDVAACEAKAQFGNGLRVAAEASNKLLAKALGFMTFEDHFLPL